MQCFNTHRLKQSEIYLANNPLYKNQNATIVYVCILEIDILKIFMRDVGIIHVLIIT